MHQMTSILPVLQKIALGKNADSTKDTTVETGKVFRKIEKFPKSEKERALFCKPSNPPSKSFFEMK